MDTFEAIADPVRRELLDLLRRSPATAGDLAASFGISRPAVSRHLRLLREAGLVNVEERGRHRCYDLEPAPLAHVDAWLDDFRDRWSDDFRDRGSDDFRDGWSPRLDALATEVHRTRRERRRATGAPSDREQTA